MKLMVTSHDYFVYSPKKKYMVNMVTHVQYSLSSS